MTGFTRRYIRASATRPMRATAGPLDASAMAANCSRASLRAAEGRGVVEASCASLPSHMLGVDRPGGKAGAKGLSYTLTWCRRWEPAWAEPENNPPLVHLALGKKNNGGIRCSSINSRRGLTVHSGLAHGRPRGNAVHGPSYHSLQGQRCRALRRSVSGPASCTGGLGTNVVRAGRGQDRNMGPTASSPSSCAKLYLWSAPIWPSLAGAPRPASGSGWRDPRIARLHP